MNFIKRLENARVSLIMNELEELRQKAISVGGEMWGNLADAYADGDFRQLLTPQEVQILNRLKDDSRGNMSGYNQYYSDILAKYIAWKIYKDTNLKHLEKKVSALSEKVTGSEIKLQAIEEAAEFIGGATILVEYSKAFNKTSGQHKIKAKTELWRYFISLFGFVSITWLVFFVSIAELPIIKNLLAEDITSLPLYLGVFALKAFILVFAYQITQFFRKNYGAEKHLEEVYRHRADVLQSLHAVYNALNDKEERDRILSAGALFAYERGETGYISTKEGAGSSGEGMIEGIIAGVLKR
jgi:hypothetical protein